MKRDLKNVLAEDRKTLEEVRNPPYQVWETPPEKEEENEEEGYQLTFADVSKT